jgi:hypothetical protein
MNDNINNDNNKVDSISIVSIDTDEVAPKDKGSTKCAPHIKFDKGSCIELPILVEMAKAYNKVNDKQIKLHDRLETLNPPKYKKYLLNEMKKRYDNLCKTQICWTQQDFIKKMNKMMKEELLKYTFRPEGPKGKFEWLNTTHLNEVMEQYEKVHKDFKFLGAVPMDFDKLPSLGIKGLDLKKLYNDGIKKIGVIFNLDEHWQSGSHWVSAYTNLENGESYFSDSYGIAPDKRVRELLRRFGKFSEENLNIKAIAKHNKTRHQRGNSECGMYSLNFILELLNGKSFDELEQDAIPDKRVNELRPIFFYNVEFKTS